MKKGKRQVMQRPLSPEQSYQTQPQQYLIPLTTQNSPPKQSLSKIEQKTQFPKYEQDRKYDKNQQNLQIIDEMDEKKKKIQMLKQKYLKKKVQNLNSSQIQIRNQNNTQIENRIGLNSRLDSHENQENYKRIVYNNQQIDKANHMNNDFILKSSSQVIKNHNEAFEQTRLNLKTIPPYKPIHSGTVPLPGVKKQLLIPVPAQKILQQIQPSFSQLNSHYSKQHRQLEQNNKSQSNEHQERQKVENIPKYKHMKVPPPPPGSRNMKEILNKKFSPLTVVQAKNIHRNIIQNNSNQCAIDQDQFQGPNSKIMEMPCPKPIIKPPARNIQIDEQYSQNSPKTQMKAIAISPSLKNNKDVISSVKQINLTNLLSSFIQSPELTLKELFPNLLVGSLNLIDFYCSWQSLVLEISSVNSTFGNSMVKHFVQAFIVNNICKLTQDQVQVTESICLQYFYNNSAGFQDVFLVCLVKMGKVKLLKYSKALQDKFQYYLGRLILFRNLFLQEQIQTFLQFCIETNLIKNDNFYLYMMFTNGSSQKLTNYLIKQDIRSFDLKDSISLLCICKLNLKQKKGKLIGLYLKLLSDMTHVFSQNKLVEKVLGHLKELEIPQSYYQVLKQLRLKMLKNYDEVRDHDESYNNNLGRNQANHKNQSISNSNDEEKGLFGFFNINKAIDKIKTSTTNALQAVQKTTKTQPPVQNQEEKADVIVYDPVKKRYVINGIIPEDEDVRRRQADNNEQESKIKAPPPPPLGIKRVPPPVPGKKAVRLAANRYV